MIAFLVCKLLWGKKGFYFQTWPADVSDGMLSEQLFFLLSRHMLTVPTAAAHTNQRLFSTAQREACQDHHTLTVSQLVLLFFPKELADCMQVITYWRHQGLIQDWETLFFQSPRLMKWSVLIWNQKPPLCQNVISKLKRRSVIYVKWLLGKDTIKCAEWWVVTSCGVFPLRPNQFGKACRAVFFKNGNMDHVGCWLSYFLRRVLSNDCWGWGDHRLSTLLIADPSADPSTSCLQTSGRMQQ